MNQMKYIIDATNLRNPSEKELLGTIAACLRKGYSREERLKLRDDMTFTPDAQYYKKNKSGRLRIGKGAYHATCDVYYDDEERTITMTVLNFGI